MNRLETIDFINEKILPQWKDDDFYWLHNGREVMKKLIKMIAKWRHGKNINIEMNPVVIDGVLYINGDCLGRFAPKAARPPFDERAYYIEGRILARQEVY